MCSTPSAIKPVARYIPHEKCVSLAHLVRYSNQIKDSEELTSYNTESCLEVRQTFLTSLFAKVVNA